MANDVRRSSRSTPTMTPRFVVALLLLLGGAIAQTADAAVEQARNLVRQAQDESSIKKRVELLRQAVALVPAADMPHYLLAVELQCQGDIDAAMAEYRTVLEINPDLYFAAYALGQLHVRAMQPEAGVPFLEAALAKAAAHGAADEEEHRIRIALDAAKELCVALPGSAAAESLADWADDHRGELDRLRTDAARAATEVPTDAVEARQIAWVQVLVGALLESRNQGAFAKGRRGRLVFLVAQQLVAMGAQGGMLGDHLPEPRSLVAGTRDATGPFAAVAAPEAAMPARSSDGAWLVSAQPRHQAAPEGPAGTYRVFQDGRDAGTVRIEVDGSAVRFLTAGGRVIPGTVSGRHVQATESRTGNVGQFLAVTETTMELDFSVDWQSATGTSVSVARITNSPIAVGPNRTSSTVRLERSKP